LGISGGLMRANSGLNPMLYAWGFPKFKETFKYVWRQIARLLPKVLVKKALNAKRSARFLPEKC